MMSNRNRKSTAQKRGKTMNIAKKGNRRRTARSAKRGIVYILVPKFAYQNEDGVWQPVIKIGKTRDMRTLVKRIVNLFNTSVALPFDFFTAAWVEDNDDVEKQKMHKIFAADRVGHEYFFTDRNDAAAELMKYSCGEIQREKFLAALNKSKELREKIEKAQIALRAHGMRADNTLSSGKYRGKFDFPSLGIPNGAVIVSMEDDVTTAIVDIKARGVWFEGKLMSVQKASEIMMLRVRGKVHKHGAPGRWKYNGVSLNELRTRERKGRK